MKEKPILMSGPEVRAILEGRKTQTRRLVKGMPEAPTPDCHPSHTAKHPVPYFDAYCGARRTEANPRGMDGFWNWWQVDDRACLPQIKCPYGVPGDRLWVREAWRVGKSHDKKSPTQIWDGLKETNQGVTMLYEAGGWRSVCPIERAEPEYPDDEPMPSWAGRKRSSILMPRWASRITLEITDVRVQRLQEISAEDCCDEGVLVNCSACTGECSHLLQSPKLQKDVRDRFAMLWDIINGNAHSWSSNPWVWALSFNKI